MGLPIVPPPETYPRGIACLLCDDDHWPPGSTPATFYVQTFGISPCNGYSSWELNFILDLNQVPGQPCRWLGNDALSTSIFWNEPTPFPPMVATFFLSEEPGGDDICYEALFDCERSGVNIRDVCDPLIAGINGGWSLNTFIWMDYVATKYNLVPTDDTLYEVFNGPDIGPVVRYASRKYSINVKVKMDMSQLPTDQEGIF